MGEEKAQNGVVKHHGLVQVSSWCAAPKSTPEKQGSSG